MDIENKEGHSPSLPKAENDPVKEQEQKREDNENKSDLDEIKQELNRSNKPVTLSIKNLTTNTNERHLREIFSNYGAVRRVKLLRRDQTAISQGVGLVEMNSEEEALKAMDYLDGAQIDGVVVYVQRVFKSVFDEEKRREASSRHHHHSHSGHERSDSHSRRRFRSRSRSRSRSDSRSRHHRSQRK